MGNGCVVCLILDGQPAFVFVLGPGGKLLSGLAHVEVASWNSGTWKSGTWKTSWKSSWSSMALRAAQSHRRTFQLSFVSITLYTTRTSAKLLCWANERDTTKGWSHECRYLKSCDLGNSKSVLCCRKRKYTWYMHIAGLASKLPLKLAPKSRPGPMIKIPLRVYYLQTIFRWVMTLLTKMRLCCSLQEM